MCMAPLWGTGGVIRPGDIHEYYTKPGILDNKQTHSTKVATKTIKKYPKRPKDLDMAQKYHTRLNVLDRDPTYYTKTHAVLLTTGARS